MLGAGKNQRAVEIGALKQRHEQIEFLLRRDRIDRVGDGLRRSAPRTDLNRLGFPQDPGGQPLDFGRKGGREKQRLPIGGNLFHNPPHVGQKAHVEHAIDFVEDEDVDIAEIHRALLEQIEQAARASRRRCRRQRAASSCCLP